MSVTAMSWVFGLEGEHAPKLGTRLVLLALADNAGAAADYDDAHVAWPAVETIARKALLSKRQTQYALKQLREAGLIRAIDTSSSGTTVYRLMLERGADIAPVQNPQGAESGTEGVQPIAPESSVEPSVDTSTSENDHAPTSEINDASPIPPVPPAPLPDTPGGEHAPRLALLLAELMLANDGKAKTSADAKGWLDPFRLLIDRDGRDPAEVERVLRWSQTDEFWRGNILSPGKFRTQYPRLRMAAERNATAASSPRNTPSIEQTRAQQRSLGDWINRPAGTSRGDLDRRTGAH